MEGFCDFMVLSEYFPTLDPKDTGNAVFQSSVFCHLKSAACP